jgi:threonine dehydrogenase-like Zn-dependent dehydrogenase
MKAALFFGLKEGVRVEDVPNPMPGPGEVLIRVAACGVCHTDLHYVDHGVPTFKAPPLILGHEASGTVEKQGERTGRFPVGTRVLIPPVIPCEDCDRCREGRPNICRNMKMLGNRSASNWPNDLFVPEDACALSAIANAP